MNLSRPQLADARVRAHCRGIDWSESRPTVYHGLDSLAVSDIYPNFGPRPRYRRTLRSGRMRSVCSRRPDGKPDAGGTSTKARSRCI